MRGTFYFFLLLPLPAVDHRDAHADQHQRGGIAQKRRFASSIHQRQREEHAENRLQKRIDRHTRNRIDAIVEICEAHGVDKETSQAIAEEVITIL